MVAINCIVFKTKSVNLSNVAPTSLLHVVYNYYVLPNFDYACTIWGCVNANTKCIQRVQNRAARIILCKKIISLMCCGGLPQWTVASGGLPQWTIASALQ